MNHLEPSAGTAAVERDEQQSLTSSETAHPLPLTIITPSRGWVALKLGELWNYRELLWILTLKDVKIRYKQTLLGAAWALLQPLFTMIIMTVIFGRLARLPSEGIPYPLFTFAALLPWQLFARGLTESTTSLANNRSLVTKVYFPRLVLPFSAVLSGLVDFAVSFGLLVLMLGHYRIAPSVNWVFLPLFVVFAILTALAIGLWLSAINARYRDVAYTVPFLVQIWMFATPVGYSSSLVPAKWRVLYGLNPMTGVVDGFRWALFGQHRPLGPEVFASVASVLVLLVLGLAYFRRMERHVADVV